MQKQKFVCDYCGCIFTIEIENREENVEVEFAVCAKCGKTNLAEFENFE